MELQWPLILFTTFIAWSAGLFGAQGCYAIADKGRKAQMPALIASVVLMAIGGIAVFFHLEHWERIFNGFGHITSGITQELIFIVVMFVVMVVYFAMLRRTPDDEKLPSWIGIAAIASAVVLVGVMGHSYMMAARPAWDSVLQVLSLIGAGVALGAGTMAVLTGDEEAEFNGKINVIAQIVGAACIVIYVVAMAMASGAFTNVPFWFDPTSPSRDVANNVLTSPFAGEALVPTVVAIIGAIAAAVAGFLGKKQGNWKLWGAVAVAGIVIASICLRVAMYLMGGSVYPFF